MPRHIGRRFIADWKRSGAPEIPGLFVPEIEGLARPVGDRVVGPWGQLMLAAVHRPGVAAALSGYLEAEAGIGHHVDPWGRGRLARPEDGHIFSAPFGEAPQPVEVLYTRRRTRYLKLGSGRGSRCHGPRRRPSLGRALKLIGEPSARS